MSIRTTAALWTVGVGGMITGIIGGPALALPVLYPDRIFPGVAVQGIPLGGKTPAEAQVALGGFAGAEEPLVLLKKDGVPVLEPARGELGVALDAQRTVQAAYAVGRRTGLSGFLERVRLLAQGRDAPAFWKVNRSALATYVHRSLGSFVRSPKTPTSEFRDDGTFVFHPGEPGTALDINATIASVADRVARGSSEPVDIPFIEVPAGEVGTDVRVTGADVQRVRAQSLALLAGETVVAVPPEALATWAGPSVRGETSGPTGSVEEIDRSVVEQYLVGVIAPQVAAPARESVFEPSGGRTARFEPAVPGRRLRIAESTTGILHGLAAGATRIELVTQEVAPRVTVTPEMATYGIRARIGRGETDFAGSPPNRIHNIRVGAAKYNGVLIPPGAEFSFNENLGPVDAEHGFRRELVILTHVTTPQFGGGLCQVSTTMFRAAVQTGLPITARKNHAYAVSYYGTPGFDATIYPPNPDLRFVNDTPGHLLIRTHMEGTKLAFEFWGSSDGRQVEVRGPFPYARQTSGAVKAQLARAVRRSDGTVNEETWYSSYKSPKLFPKVLEANAERESWEERARRIAEKDRRAQEEFDRRKAELERRQRAARSSQKETIRPSPTPEPASQSE